MAAEPIVSQNLDSKNKRAEPKKKFLKKKRSIRFSRVPSRRFVMSPIDDLGSDDSSLQQSSSVGSSDSLPNYTTNSPNSFIENKGGNEFDDANSMISSSSGSTEHIVQHSEVISSDDDEGDTQNSYSSGFLDGSSKAEGLSEGRKKNSLRNGKVLIKNVSFKPKRALRENEVNSYVNRATCSSIIKDSRFPDHVELQESDKVCRYHHCSLHGHCHDAQPLVKKFSFRRRQQVKKPQMNMKKSNVVSKPNSRFSADKKELKKPEITESVGASDNKNTLEKNMKSKAFKEGQDSLDLDSNLKGKSSENIPSDIALILSSGDTNGSRKDSNESRLNVKNEESTNNQVSTESTQGGDFKTSPSMKLQVPQSKKGKEISMWHMIHKQIISSLAEEDEKQARKPVMDEVKQVEYTKDDTPNGSNQGSINNVEEGNQELEIRKLFAIKLVREAIENILLPEVQDQSSETQSITSDTIEDHQEDNAENHVNRSTNRDADSATSDDVGVVSCTKDSINEPANDRPETKKVESEKKSPGNWSSLKKWIVLQRFVKALEKVRKYKPSNPRELPLESDPKGEKVSLRRQTFDGRKNSEEWMLDYAIRQVVSQLAPTQKKKVTLLVKAFETIVPPQDDYSTQVSWPQLKGERQKSVRKVDDTEDMKQEARGNGADVDVSMVNDAHFPEKSAVHSLRENVPLIEESQHKINSQKTLTLSTKPLVHDSEPYLNLENRDEASSTIRSTSSDIDVKSKATENTESEKPKTTKEHIQINNVAKESTLLQESTARNEIYTESKPKQTLSHESSLDSRLDKENYLRMWHMIYQHVASNIASKVDLLGGEEDKQVKDFNTSSDIVTSTPRVISMGERKFSKSDAVKLIQEAVDEILLQDDDISDTQSVTTETTPDMFLYERNRDEVLNKSISNTSVLNEEYVKEFNRSDSGVSIEESKPTIPKPKNWRKLKRLILLKRSIKAMEKSRKLKSLQPQKNLPLISDAEPEKVDLKHQMVNERIKAEQWMLDYAVQNIVSELTPARKRRVAMLVEAFEAVVPLPEI